MSVNLTDYVDTLRREVTPPGSTTFSTVSDDVFAGYLADAFWEVKLDGFMEPYVADAVGVVIPANDPQALTLGPYNESAYNSNNDIPRDQIALVCLYAAITIIRNNLMETKTKTVAKAGPVSFEQDSSASFLVAMLSELAATKMRLLYLKTFNQNVSLIDAFSARSTSAASYSGYLYDWWQGAFGSPDSDIYDNTGIL